MKVYRLLFMLSAVLMTAGCDPAVVPGDNIVLADGWTLRSDAGSEKWPATVPSTVAGVLFDNGYFTEDIFRDDNYLSLDKTIFETPWTYTKRFNVSGLGDSHAFLQFDGIGYRADIILNGKTLRSKDNTFGVFNRYTIDVTDCLEKSNTLEVRVEKAHKGDLNIGFVDWNPRPLDESMGIWRDVTLHVTGDVRLSDGFIVPAVSEDLSSADLEVRATLSNLTGSETQAVLKGSYEGGSFEFPVTLAPGETRDVTVTPAEAPCLHLENPRLWWCWTLGSPELYEMDLAVTTEDTEVSDTDNITFGIRNIDSYIDEYGHRQFVLNGEKVLVKGAGWTDDIFLRDTHGSIELQVKYVKDMNLNAIRFENIWGKDRYVYDMCDKYGLLALVGWSCQWEWEDYCGLPETSGFGCITTPETIDLVMSYFENQVKWLRNNVSVIGWMTGSDCLPHPDLERRYLEAYARLDYRPYVGSAKNLVSRLTGPSGTKMDGPYEYVGPDYWWFDTRNGGAYGFNTETGIGANLPCIESLRKMVSEDRLWPLGRALGCHATTSGSAMNSTERLEKTIAGLYGEAVSLEDFVKKGHAVDYDGTRAMFESFRTNLPNTTGIVQWMLNSAWPSIYWQLYDYWLVPAAAYYGTKKACEPVQLIYNIKDAQVYAVNETGRTVEAEASFILLGADSKELASESKVITIADREPLAVFDLSSYRGVEGFVSLALEDSDGNPVADNFYCIPAAWNTYKWEESNWYETPIANYADMRFVTALPSASVKVETIRTSDGYRVTVTNDSDVVAYQNILTIKDSSGNLIIPAFWSDNYFSLLPNQSKTVECRTDGATGTIGITSWNQ